MARNNSNHKATNERARDMNHRALTTAHSRSPPGNTALHVLPPSTTHYYYYYYYQLPPSLR
jgi:hypothetical protein